LVAAPGSKKLPGKPDTQVFDELGKKALPALKDFY